MNSKVDAILFDLGRVLIELDGPPLKNHWLYEPISEEESWRRWGSSETVALFESGKISEEQFLQRIIPEQNIKLSQEDFKQEYSRWPKCIYPGVESALDSLRQSHTLAFYSNTNQLHTCLFMDEWRFGAYFDYCFCSHEIGYFKPDPIGFKYVADAMGVEPEKILFLDDNQNNVDGAKNLNFNAHCVIGFEQAKKVLSSFGCELMEAP